jgi:hypothetical protein
MASPIDTDQRCERIGRHVVLSPLIGELYEATNEGLAVVRDIGEGACSTQSLI